MHEQTETVQGRDKQWYNVYGGTRFPIPLLFGFEQRRYPTPGMAENRAQWRSQMGEGHYPMQPPRYGFQGAAPPFGFQKMSGFQPVGRMQDILRELDEQRKGENIVMQAIRKGERDTPGNYILEGTPFAPLPDEKQWYVDPDIFRQTMDRMFRQLDKRLEEPPQKQMVL